MSIYVVKGLILLPVHLNTLYRILGAVGYTVINTHYPCTKQKTQNKLTERLSGYFFMSFI